MKKNINIMVVEDNLMISKLLKLKLEADHEAKVTCYSDLNLAFLALDKALPDLIISDYLLGSSSDSLDGFDLLKRLEQKNIKIPVIILSGNHDKGLALEMIRQGACDYIVKRGNFIIPLMRAVNLIIKTIQIRADLSNVITLQQQSKKSMKTWGYIAIVILALFMLT